LGRGFICIDVVREIVSEKDDPSLSDPVEFFDNYQEPAGVRIRYRTIARILTEDEYSEASIINKSLIDIIEIESIFENNDPNIEIKGPTKDKPYLGIINQLLAKRTHDESGNFIATGLRISSDINTQDFQQYYNIRVSSR
jgi:hypothetical protein